MDASVPIAGPIRRAAAHSRRRDLAEIAGIYTLVILVLWVPRPWQDLLGALTAACIMAIVYGSLESFRTLGLCRRNLACSLWAVAVALFVAAAAIALALVLHTLHMPETTAMFVRHSCLYAMWASIQEVVLQCFFLSRLLRLLGHATWAAGAGAILFAVAHLPSPFLMLVTFVCGLAACLFFLRYRSLFPLVVAHAILGIVIAVTVPPPVDHNMSVGLAYVTYAHRDASLP
jgi:hypothetical protein